MVTNQKLLYQIEIFETLKDTPNTSQGFRSVAFVVLEILGGSFSTPSLVFGVDTKTLGATRVERFLYMATLRLIIIYEL